MAAVMNPVAAPVRRRLQVVPAVGSAGTLSFVPAFQGPATVSSRRPAGSPAIPALSATDRRWLFAVLTITGYCLARLLY